MPKADVSNDILNINSNRVPMPTVSVIIPNFNHANFLNQRIDSVLAQTYQDFEIIILDDCSSDKSREIINQYASNEKVSHVVYSEENSGSPFKQWKKGVDISIGSYIWIAESDDWCEATLLETLIQGIEQDEECVISYCQSYCLDDKNKIIFQSNHNVLSEMMEGEMYIQQHLSVPVALFNASMAIWRKSKFQKIPDDFLNYRFCGDWLFWIHLSRLGKVHISAKVLNYFRKHDGDVSGKAYSSGLNFIEELKIINTMYSEHLINEAKYYKAFKRKFVEFWSVRNTIDPKNRSAIILLFKNPMSNQVNLFKLKLAGIWKTLKHKK